MDMFNKLLLKSIECGLNSAVPLRVETLEFLPEVREMCAQDKCKRFNRNWSCPPACGTLAGIKEKALRYRKGILVQTVAELSGEFDWESICGAERKHKEAFLNLAVCASQLAKDIMPMSAGACGICLKCTYPDLPCRFPEKCFPSMEACGLFVSRVCEKNGLNYYYGNNMISFTSCILYGQESTK
ncbi:MAG: DUF2284 domain-containing protein [Bacillota bacterium]|nr:DUF2284 domain-containing protein [Bacillota bacterium]